jgi:hypothetical protein
MTMYRVNEEEMRVPISDASTGPEIGFVEGVKRSWQYGTLFESQFGVQQDMVAQEAENEQRIRAAGGTPPKSAYRDAMVGYKGNKAAYADRSGRAADLVRAMNESDSDSYNAIVGDRDTTITALQRQFPDAGIKTYGQMYQDQQDRYQKMKQGLERNYSAAGAVGWVAGGMAASLRPDVNPLSFVTAPVGGFGKAAVGRIATQGGAQAAVQALEEVTGVRANKRLLGEDPTVAESLLNVGAAGLVGAGLQGAGELGYVAFKGAKRRWFKEGINDPAPAFDVAPEAKPVLPSADMPPVLRDMPPLSAEANMRISLAVREALGTGGTTARTARADFFEVARQAGDWTGPRPWEIAPPTLSRALLPSEIEVPEFKARSAGETLDEGARRVDPDTFRVYDKLAADKKAARDLMETALSSRNVNVEKELQPLRTKIADLEKKVDHANRRKSKIYNEQIKDLRGQLAEREAVLIGADTNAAAIHRQQIMSADEKMRDLAPAVSRAYARAEKKWSLRNEQRQQIEDMITKGETKLDPMGPPAPTLVDKAEMEFTKAGVAEYVPELKTPGGKVMFGEDAADAVKRVHAEMEKTSETAVESLNANIPAALEKGEMKVEVDGEEHVLNLDDEIIVQGEDDELPVKTTLRAMLQDVNEQDQVMKAVSVCSAGPTSATV